MLYQKRCKKPVYLKRGLSPRIPDDLDITEIPETPEHGRVLGKITKSKRKFIRNLGFPSPHFKIQASSIQRRLIFILNTMHLFLIIILLKTFISRIFSF